MKVSRDRLALTHELYALVIDYWHDVDTNWGRNAPGYYTPDGVFKGPAASYAGREKIRQFYKWREDRGARTVVHSVHNFQCLPEGPDKATCHWFLMLYGADGNWLVAHRTFETWFEGGTPTTNPKLDDK